MSVCVSIEILQINVKDHCIGSKQVSGFKIFRFIYPHEKVLLLMQAQYFSKFNNFMLKKTKNLNIYHIHD